MKLHQISRDAQAKVKTWNSRPPVLGAPEPSGLMK